MTDAEDLYQAAILEHAKSPHNEGPLFGATHRAKVSNPLCGDRVQVELRIDEGVIRKAAFTARGCAISVASASMMTERVVGMTLEEAKGLGLALDEGLGGDEPLDEALGELRVFEGLRAFRSRIRCATLAWEAVAKAGTVGTG